MGVLTKVQLGPSDEIPERLEGLQFIRFHSVILRPWRRRGHHSVRSDFNRSSDESSHV